MVYLRGATPEINESIKLPAIKKLIRTAGPDKSDGTAASYHGGYTLTNGSLIFSGKAIFSKRLYEAQDWPEFKAAVDAQNRFADQPVVIEL